MSALSDVHSPVRRGLLALIVLGLLGTGTELVLLQHYESAWQLAPLIIIVMALVAVIGRAFTAGVVSLRILQIVMTLLIAAGIAGVALHYRGNLEFQVDMDPTLSHWGLFKKVIRAKAPPALAPGSMVQLGLLGLLYTYKHPVLARHRAPKEGR